MKKKNPSKKKNPIIQGYINSYSLFKKAKIFILISVLILIFTTLIGFAFPQLFEEQVLKIIQEMMRELEGKNATELMVLIFLNNLKASFFGMILGVFFGVFPLIASLTNGYVIGYVSNLAVNAQGIFVLWKLIPHGVFELPAILISLGIGLYLGNRFLERFFKIKKQIKRIAIMCFSTLVLIPLAGFYYVWNMKLIEVQKVGLSSLSNGSLPLAIAISIINFAIIAGFIYVIYQFLKDKQLRKDLKDSIVFFFLVIIPLLLIAAIIEGYLVIALG